MRNLGSSIGVSIAVALLGRNIQIQHSYLAEHVTPYALALDPRLLGSGESPGLSAMLALIDAEINRQAATIAYLNDFKLMMYVVIAAMPLVFLMRSPPRYA